MSHKRGKILNEIYRIVKTLGKGAMGEVYLVERKDQQKKLVLKRLVLVEGSRVDKETASKLFFREAEMIATFEHPGLPETYGVFQEDGSIYIAMEYIRGETLEEVINNSLHPIYEEQAIGWAIDLCFILDYLHNSFNSPVVYRDLKPSNIIITPEGKPRLIDFGTSRYYNPDKDTDTFRLGSPGYAPPEQYKGRGQSCPQSDVYAMGVILYQILTKYDPSDTPFKFPPIKDLNPKISSELEKIILRAIELKPLKRFISIIELKEQLEKYSGIEKTSYSDYIHSAVTSIAPATPAQVNKKSSDSSGAIMAFFIILIVILMFSCLILAANSGAEPLDSLTGIPLFVNKLLTKI